MVETKKKVVLIVEDEELVARMHKAGLAHAPFEVVVAGNGEEALSVMKTQAPDLVVTDIMMPRMNGFELLTKIKADPKLKSVPVIMMSNLSSDEDRAKATEMGADDYWVKRDMQPRQLEELLTKRLGG